jgi:uncharacterized protein (TIGR02145 family)
MKMKIKAGKYTDPRDGKIYTIALMPDGKYWFTQNLAYNPKKKGHWKKDDEHYYRWELAQKVAPKGWRLPSKDDFVALDKAVGGTGRCQRLRSSFWQPNGDFKGSYSGCYDGSGSLYNQGIIGWWWSSSEHTTASDACNLNACASNVDPQNYNLKCLGLTVRLVADTLPKGAVMDEEENKKEDKEEMTVICSESHRVICREIEIPVKVLCTYQFDMGDVEKQIRKKLERQA